MTSTIEPDDTHELLGAYALGAVDAEEAARVEDLLRRDALARRELTGYEAAMLSLHDDDGPGAGVWASIEQAIEDDPKPAIVVPLSAARERRTTRRRVVRVAIAAAAVAALVGVAVWGVRTQTQSLPTRPASDVSRAAADAAVAAGARRISLVTPAGEVVDVVVLPDGRGYVLGGRLRTARAGAEYVLVGIRNGERIILGVLGSTVGTSAFFVPDGVDQLVLELTDAAGASQPVSSATLPAPPADDATGGSGATSGAPTPTAGPQGGGAPTAPQPSLPLPSLSLPITLRDLGLPGL